MKGKPILERKQSTNSQNENDSKSMKILHWIWSKNKQKKFKTTCKAKQLIMKEKKTKQNV